MTIVRPVGGKNYPGGSGPAAGGAGGPNSNFGTQNKSGLPPTGHNGEAARQNTKASEYNSRTNHGGGPQGNRANLNGASIENEKVVGNNSLASVVLSKRSQTTTTNNAILSVKSNSANS